MKKLAFAALAATMFAMPALAQAPQHAKRQPMTLAAMQARAQAHFAKVDADHDGTLSITERQAAKAAHAAERAKRAGQKHPLLTQADVNARVAARFQRFDTNGDGAIDQNERRAAREQRKARSRG